MIPRPRQTTARVTWLVVAAATAVAASATLEVGWAACRSCLLHGALSRAVLRASYHRVVCVARVWSWGVGLRLGERWGCEWEGRGFCWVTTSKPAKVSECSLLECCRVLPRLVCLRHCTSRPSIKTTSLSASSTLSLRARCWYGHFKTVHSASPHPRVCHHRHRRRAAHDALLPTLL
jgi:hypothetical protein